MGRPLADNTINVIAHSFMHCRLIVFSLVFCGSGRCIWKFVAVDSCFMGVIVTSVSGYRYETVPPRVSTAMRIRPEYLHIYIGVGLSRPRELVALIMSYSQQPCSHCSPELHSGQQSD